MKIKYVGEGQVEVDGVGVFTYQQVVEVTQEDADRLLKNPNFVKVTEERSPETSKKERRRW